MIFRAADALPHPLPWRMRERRRGAKYAPDRPDDGDFTDTGSTDRHLGRQRESDCRDLAFGNGKTDVLLNQRHSLVRINRTVCPLRPL
jgi:hypothetical protein